MTSRSCDSVAASCWDAVVVGAGPAGAVAARELALRGCRVLLVDKKSFPRWKVCGACLSGQAVSMLEQVGLAQLPDRLGGVPLHTFQLRAGTRELELRIPAGVAVSRSRLDSSLVDAAVEAGAEFLPETIAVVGDATADDRTVVLRRHGTAATVVARVVLVADGLGHASLADHEEFRTVAARQTRIGAGCIVSQVPAGLPRGTIRMVVGRHGYLGMVRLEDGTANVAAAFDPARVRECGGLGSTADELLRESGLALDLSLAGQEWRGTPMLTQRPRSVAARRLFVLGDAAGYVEPFTGEGMARALESAVALAPLAHRAVHAWCDELARNWTRTHLRLIRHRLWLCRLLAWSLKHPILVRGGIQICCRVPSLAHRVACRVQAPVPLFQG